MNGAFVYLRSMKAPFMVYDLGYAADGLQAVLAGVVGGARRAEREVALRGEDQDYESGRQGQVAVDQADADAYRDQRD